MTDQNPHAYESARTSVLELLEYVKKLRGALEDARVKAPADNGVVRKACGLVDLKVPYQFSGFDYSAAPGKTDKDFQKEIEEEIEAFMKKGFKPSSEL